MIRGYEILPMTSLTDDQGAKDGSAFDANWKSPDVIKFLDAKIKEK